MPRGGARPGAGRPKGGRPKGSINKNSRTLRSNAAATGDLPAEILLDIARYHHKRAKDLRAIIGKLPALTTVDVQGEIRTEHAMAASAADKVMPYYHPRLTPIQRPSDGAGPSTLEQMLLALDAPANDDGTLQIEGAVVKDAAE